jgi:hypothetical protein
VELKLSLVSCQAINFANAFTVVMKEKYSVYL